MNPETLKRREYIGIFCLIVGVLLLIPALLGVLFAWEPTIALAIAAIATVAVGIAVLRTVPDLAHTTDESW